MLDFHIDNLEIEKIIVQDGKAKRASSDDAVGTHFGYAISRDGDIVAVENGDAAIDVVNIIVSDADARAVADIHAVSVIAGDAVLGRQDFQAVQINVRASEDVDGVTCQRGLRRAVFHAHPLKATPPTSFR